MIRGEAAIGSASVRGSIMHSCTDSRPLSQNRLLLQLFHVIALLPLIFSLCKDLPRLLCGEAATGSTSPRNVHVGRHFYNHSNGARAKHSVGSPKEAQQPVHPQLPLRHAGGCQEASLSQSGCDTTTRPLGNTALRRRTAASGTRGVALPFAATVARVASELRPLEAEETAAGPPLTTTLANERSATHHAEPR